MEERTVDKENGRKIKLKRTQEGGIDVLEESGGDEEDVEALVDFGDDDEELAGLSPEETEEILKKREEAQKKAYAERDKLLEEGERLLRSKSYSQAEPFFLQALLYDPDHRRAREAVWICRTENFSDTKVFYEKKYAEEFAQSDQKTKDFMLSKLSGRLEEEREKFSQEQKAMEGGFLAAQRKRRAAFSQNRKYYLLRVVIFSGVFVLFLVAAVLSLYFIVRTRTNIPIILASSFGAVALISLFVTVLYMRGLYGAQRLCSENEKLSSTEEGARLEFLRGRLECLGLVLEKNGKKEN